MSDLIRDKYGNDLIPDFEELNRRLLEEHDSKVAKKRKKNTQPKKPKGKNSDSTNSSKGATEGPDLKRDCNSPLQESGSTSGATNTVSADTTHPNGDGHELKPGPVKHHGEGRANFNPTLLKPKKNDSDKQREKKAAKSIWVQAEDHQLAAEREATVRHQESILTNIWLDPFSSIFFESELVGRTAHQISVVIKSDFRSLYASITDDQSALLVLRAKGGKMGRKSYNYKKSYEHVALLAKLFAIRAASFLCMALMPPRSAKYRSEFSQKTSAIKVSNSSNILAADKAIKDEVSELTQDIEVSEQQAMLYRKLINPDDARAGIRAILNYEKQTTGRNGEENSPNEDTMGLGGGHHIKGGCGIATLDYNPSCVAARVLWCDHLGSRY